MENSCGTVPCQGHVRLSIGRKDTRGSRIFGGKVLRPTQRHKQGVEKWRDGGTMKWVLILKPVRTISSFPYACGDISGSAYQRPVNVLWCEIMVGW